MKELDSHELSADLLQFLLTRIESVPELEALLLLREDPYHAWTVDELARRLYTSPRDVELIVARLVAKNLAMSEPGGAVRFNGGGDDAERVERLARAYGLNLARISQVIHSRGGSAVRDFARAFDVKGRK